MHTLSALCGLAGRPQSGASSVLAMHLDVPCDVIQSIAPARSQQSLVLPGSRVVAQLVVACMHPTRRLRRLVVSRQSTCCTYDVQASQGFCSP